MAKNRHVTVTRESDTGRNESFRDTTTNRYMSRDKFVKAIKHGSYEGYHIRVIGGIETPVSNPDGKVENNLG